MLVFTGTFMRILFLSNLFPPESHGGYEQWCRETAEGLRARGHEVTVLTTHSSRRYDALDEPGWIRRRLHMEMEFGTRVHSLNFFTRRQVDEQENLECLRQTFAEAQPEAIMIWGMWNLHRSLAATAEALLPDGVVYYLGDYWPTLPSQHQFYWDAPAQNWMSWLPKTLLKPVARKVLENEAPVRLEFARALFPSQFLLEEYRRRGVPFRQGEVIAGAVDTERFFNPQPGGSSRLGPAEPLKLLYAGRISPEKGVETAIEAIEILVRRGEMGGMRLTIAGSGERAYVARLQERVEKQGLGKFIAFLPPVSPGVMPELYRLFDVYLFTSTWQEPFGRVLVEALASGMVVIGTATGGAGEILKDGENALVFPPGDARTLAAQILHLQSNPSLAERLIASGQEEAVHRYDTRRMVDEIEAYLLSLRERVEA